MGRWGRWREWRIQGRRDTLIMKWPWDDAHKWNLSHLSHAMWCAIMCDEDKTRLKNCAIHFTCQCSCALCGRCSGSWWSRCHWCRASCRSVSPRIRNTKCRVLSFLMLQFMLQSDCILWSSISSEAKLLHTFCIAKTGHLRCCLYTPRRLQ